MRILPVLIILSLIVPLAACMADMSFLDMQKEQPLPNQPEGPPPVAHTAHIPGEWEPHKAATCDETATEKTACTECGLLLETRSVGEPLGHEYAWYITNKPHSGGAGVEEYTCIHDPSHANGEYQRRTYQRVTVKPPAYQPGEIETIYSTGSSTQTFSIHGVDVPFTAAVAGENSLQTINWLIYGTNLSKATTINADGVLTIDAADYGKKITVTAASTIDKTKRDTTSVTAVPYLPSALAASWLDHENNKLFTASYDQNEDTNIFYYQMFIENHVEPLILTLNAHSDHYYNDRYYELFSLTFEYDASFQGYKAEGMQATRATGGCESPECNSPWRDCNTYCGSCFCHLSTRLYIFVTDDGNTLRLSGNGNFDNTPEFIKW